MKKSIFGKFGLAAAVVPLLMAGQTAFAAQDTATFNVTATVDAACEISATDLGFGNYNGLLGTDVDATTTVGVNCTNGTAYTVGLSTGSNGGSAVGTTRAMSDGTNFLNYDLYTDSGRTTVWNDILGTNVQTGTGNGSAQNFTVYGRIPGSQTDPAGSYSDIITATVDF